MINFDSDLTPQQQAFVAEYVLDFNAKRSAIAAGYSEKTAHVQCYQLLGNPYIQKAIQAALDDYGTKYDVLKQRVLNQLANIAFSDITDYQTFRADSSWLKDSTKLTRKQSAAIQEVKVKTFTGESGETSTDVTLKLCSKEKALELLGRHLGMFNDKLTVVNPPQQMPDKKMNFEDFCVFIGYPRPYKKQVEIADFAIDSEGARMVLGARGYGKTDFAVICKCAYRIYLNPLVPRYFLITKSDTRNAAIVSEISKALIKVGVTLEKNNSEELRVSGLQGKDATFSSATIKSASMRGRHPGLVIMDDPVTPEDTSEATRAHAKKVYNEILKLAKNVVIIGQPVHKFDLYEELRKQIKCMEVPYGSIPELDADLEAQRLAGVDEASIQASYYLKILSEGTVPFENIRLLDKFPTSESVAFIDPSFEGGDYTAVSIVTAFMEGVAVVGFAYKKSWNHCLEEISKEFKRFKVKRACFETNALGDQPLEILREAFDNIGVVGRKSNTNKHSRIMQAGAFAHMIHLSKESNKPYSDQVIRYEYKAKNDDAPDSLASCLQWLGLIRGKE